jgi:hypothetical protein
MVDSKVLPNFELTSGPSNHGGGAAKNDLACACSVDVKTGEALPAKASWVTARQEERGHLAEELKCGQVSIRYGVTVSDVAEKNLELHHLKHDWTAVKAETVRLLKEWKCGPCDDLTGKKFDVTPPPGSKTEIGGCSAEVQVPPSHHNPEPIIRHPHTVTSANGSPGPIDSPSEHVGMNAGAPQRPSWGPTADAGVAAPVLKPQEHGGMQAGALQGPSWGPTADAAANAPVSKPQEHVGMQAGSPQAAAMSPSNDALANAPVSKPHESSISESIGEFFHKLF